MTMLDETQLRSLAQVLLSAQKQVSVSPGPLARALAQMRVEEVPAGTVLYEEGGRAEHLHLLVHGCVEVLAGPARQQVARIEGPAFVGHLGVLTGLPRSATVVAVGPAKVARMAARDLWALVSKEDPAGVALRRVLIGGLVGLLVSNNERLAVQVAESGTVIPPARLATRTPSLEQRQRLHQAGATADWGFDAELLEAAEKVVVVHTEADEARKYKR